MSEKVKIHKIKPDGSEGDHLKDYFFQQDENNILNFYGPEGQGPLNESTISLGLPFKARLLDGRTFTVTVEQMSGSWVDDNEHRIAQDPGDGTFQAQAGGTGEPEDEAASSAYA
jgi:hypothetical protein